MYRLPIEFLHNSYKKQQSIIQRLKDRVIRLENRNFAQIENDPNFRKLRERNETLDELNNLLLEKCARYEDIITDMYNTMLKHGIHYK